MKGALLVVDGFDLENKASSSIRPYEGIYKVCWRLRWT